MHTPVPVQRGLVPIHYAANEGRLEAVRTLVNECHCDPEIRDVVSHKQLQTYHRCSYVRTCMHMYVHTCTMTGGGGQQGFLILHGALQWDNIRQVAALHSDHYRQVPLVGAGCCRQVAALHSDHYRQVPLVGRWLL